MIPGRDRGSNDALVCADLLGAFGVTPSDVRRRVDGDASLEATLADALCDARDRTEFCRRLICEADRGIDCAARYGAAELESELRSLLEGLGWSAAVERSGDETFDVVVTDGSGRRREIPLTYPDTPLGTDNLPAVLSALERRLLPGVDARFVLLSDGEDRWRAALIETDELERLRERYGDRVSTFDRPLLSRFEPDDYVPDRTPDGRGDVPDRIAGGSDEVPDPWPDWAAAGTTRATDDASASSSAVDVGPPAGPGSDAALSSEDGATAVDGLIEEAEPERRDEAADASGTGPTLGEMWATDDDGADGDADSDVGGSSPARSVAGESTASESPSLESGSDPFGGTERSGSGESESAGTKPTEAKSSSAGSTETEPAGTESGGRTADSRSNRDSASPDSGVGSAPTTSEATASTAGESSGGGLTLAGGSPSVSRVREDGIAEDSATTAGTADARQSSQSGTGGGGHSREGSSRGHSRPDAGEGDSSASEDSSAGADSSGEGSSAGEPASNVSTRDARETETSGFGTLSGSTKTARVTNDAFGADVETQTEDERYQALGAALGSGRNVSVKGLLDDDEFLPELPAVEPETTRIEFDDEFEPEAVSEAKAAAEESGFVWVDSGSMETTRVSNG